MEVNFSSYRDSINASLRQWPELSWLNRFLQTPTPANGDKTSVHVFELLDNHFVESGTDSTAASLSQVLEVNVQSSRLRIVLICHGNSWDVDRNIVDIVCSKYSVDPRFVAKHFDYPDIRFEKNCPQDLRSAVNKVNDHYSENKYIWELGGDVMFPLSVQLGSCFSFAYQMNCLSLAVCQKDDKETSSQASQNSSDSFLTLSTVLLFLRAPQSQLSETSRIFFHRPNAQVTRSTLFRTQTSNSLSREFIRVLSELEISENESRDRFIAETILPYLVNLAGCCYAQYLRNIAPNALRAVDPIRTDNELLINDIQQLTQPRREVEAFLVRFPENKFGVNCTLSRSKELCRILYELTEDSKDLLLLSRAENRANESSDLGELIQAQVDEAKEAKDTSVKLGNLSQLAYVFLPLQLATSVMGMNLKTFGTGTVELRTFLIIFVIIATLSFVPILLPLIFRLFFRPDSTVLNRFVLLLNIPDELASCLDGSAYFMKRA